MPGFAYLCQRLASPTPKCVSAGFAFLVVAATANAALPTDPAARAQVVGKPAALMIQPKAITLSGPRAMQQVVVSAVYADNSVRDLTAFCELTMEGADLAQIGSSGFLLPRKNGSGTLVARAGGQIARAAVTIKDYDKPQPVSFRHEMIAAMNVGGCNAGACHGTPSGKNGFKLSLRGYDPAADYLQLTRDVFGRRTDREDPMASLIMQQALGRIPHEGGQRFQEKS